MASSFLKAGRFMWRSDLGFVTITYDVEILFYHGKQKIRIPPREITEDINNTHTSVIFPFGSDWEEATNSTMWSLTAKSQPISLFHFAFRSWGRGSNLHNPPNTEADKHFMVRDHLSYLSYLHRDEIFNTEVGELPDRFVMALDMARALETPFPPPDKSSPRSSFAKRFFIISISAILSESLMRPRYIRWHVNRWSSCKYKWMNESPNNLSNYNIPVRWSCKYMYIISMDELNHQGN